MQESIRTPLEGGYFVWEPPSRDVVVLLKLSLVELLKHLTEASANEEVGGVLLGRAESGKNANDPQRVWIDGFEAVESEHVRGPAYALSSRDTKALDRYLSRSRRGGGDVPVGFFRSHLRKGIYLDEADFALFQSHFAGASDVFLVARPRPGDVPTAGFFFWEDGTLHRQGTYTDFPLDPERLSSGAYRLEAAPLVAAEATAPSRALAAAEIPDRARATRQLFADRRTVRKGVYAAVGTALILTALLAATLTHSRGRQDQTAVSLNVERDGNKLRLSWDPSATAVERANDGVLWIADGGAHKKLELRPETLKSGSYLYTPESPDVNFRLDLRRVSEQASESVRYIADADATAARPAAAPPPAASGEGNKPTVASEPVPPPVIPDEKPAWSRRDEMEHAHALAARRMPSEEGADRRIPVQSRATPAPPLANEPVARQEPPAQVAKAVAPPEPDVSATTHAAPPPAISASGALPSVERPHVRQESTVSITTEPVAPTRIDKWVHRVPLLRTFAHNSYKAGGDFTPPRPSHEVTPHIPPRLAKEMPGEWRVDLKLGVDSDGRVDEVQLMSPRSDERLVGIAADAMKQWRFTPARLRDKAVDCDLLVTLHFRNPTPDGVVAQRQ